MAGFIHQQQHWHYQRRPCLFREHFHPLNEYDDLQLFERFRFRRQDIKQIVDMLREDLQIGYMMNGALSPELQVLLTLRFYATGSLQIVAGDTVNVDKSTVSRTIHRVTEAICQRPRDHIRLSNQAGGNVHKP